MKIFATFTAFTMAISSTLVAPTEAASPATKADPTKGTGLSKIDGESVCDLPCI